MPMASANVVGRLILIEAEEAKGRLLICDTVPDLVAFAFKRR